MLVDINPNLELPDYKLILCKLNTETVSPLKNITDFQIDAYFANIDEISFNIPLYRLREDGTTIRNEIYDLVRGDMLIFLNKTKYFYIDKADEKSDSNGIAYKMVHAFSREFEMSQKKVLGYSGVSRCLWDITNPKDENGLEIGVMNYIEKRTSWRVGYINSNLTTKYRSFDFSNTNILQMMIEIQKSFGCLFRFNTIDKVIDIYEVTQLGNNQGLYISNNNYINSLDKKINHNEIKTRLWLYGNNNVSIQSINITGQPYIENYGYYKKPDFMSQELIDALNEYEEFVQTKQGLFNGYLTDLESLTTTLGTKSDELVALNTQLKNIRVNLDIAVTSGQPTTVYKTQETNKLAEVTAKTNEVTNLNNQIDTINATINGLGTSIAINNHLTMTQINELDNFIKEEVFSDSNYTEDNIQELFNEGVRLLNKISQPAIQFDTDVVDFLSSVECQHVWKKFILGDLVKIHHDEIGIDFEVRLIGYKHNPDSNKLSLIFSNRDSVDNADVYLRDLLNSMNTTSTTVDFNKLRWDKGEDAQSAISQYINNALDLSKQEILKATGQQPMLDERGIWIVKENPDGSIDPKQMRLINNILAITNDNWNTVSTAISGDGVNADVVRGTLGQFAKVQAHQIVIGDFGQKISNDVLDIDIDLDGVVQQEELYNQVVISYQNGLQVLDKALRERIRLGNYKVGKYGIVIKDKSGSTTVLDEDGILQTWQEGRADNVDSDSPLNLYLYIPEQTNIIHKALLRFKREKFRAYSKATRSKEAVTKSTASGGAFVESTLSGGGTTKPTSGGIDVDQGWEWTETPGEDHEHRYWHVTAHTHDVEIPAHSHYMNIPDHAHQVEIPEHKHDIDYGIYESTLPSNIQIKINDVNYSTYLGAKTGFFNENRDNIDITPLLKVGQWNTITISSETLGRIDASVFLQAFINTDRKSVILDDRYISGESLGFGTSFGQSAITGRRINIESGVDYLYRISINNNIASVYSLRWTGSNYGWTNEFDLGNASTVAIAMNGTWIYDEVDMKNKLQTEEHPYLFWVNGGNLYTQRWRDNVNRRLLSENVTKVSSIRGWKNNAITSQDQGIVCAYIKTDGKVYYRNYCTQADGSIVWENEREVTDFVGTAVNVSMFITNDYRLGFVIEDSANKTHILITSRNWAGMAIAPDNITASPVRVGVEFKPIEYFVSKETNNITSTVSNVIAELKYALTDNKFIDIYNQPIIVNDVEDWGKELIFGTKYKLNNLNKADFEIVDKFNRSYLPDTVESVGDKLYKLTFLDFNNFNNVNDIGMLKFKGLYSTNGINLIYEPFEKVFYPENLVPTENPLPEVEAIWNE